jgi:hypothetical protein
VDLRLYVRVLWRFRFLVAIGVIVGSVLALLAAVRIEFVDGAPQLSYRQSEEWQSEATLLVTEQGFPEGHKAPVPEEWHQGGNEPVFTGPTFAEPQRFDDLALIYANLVETDAVRGAFPPGALADATIEGQARTSESGEAIPFIDVVASAASPRASRALARRSAEALRDYVTAQQAANGIPESERVQLIVAAYPREAELVVARPKALPLIAFLAAFLVVVALAFVIENIRPRSSPGHPEPRASRL